MSAQEVQYRDLKTVAELEYSVANYRRRYIRIDKAPELIRAHWERVEAELVAQFRLPAPPTTATRREGLAPGVPSEGSKACYDINDVAAFCRAILEKELRRRGQSFQAWFSYDDALSFLVEHTYKFAWRYDPARTKSFRLYATFKLTHHVVPDIGRFVLKRNGAGIAELAHAEVDDRADSGRRPWESSPEDSGDLLASGSRDRAGVEADRVGSEAWRGAVLSLRVHRRAADGPRVRQRDLPDSF